MTSDWSLSSLLRQIPTASSRRQSILWGEDEFSLVVGWIHLHLIRYLILDCYPCSPGPWVAQVPMHDTQWRTRGPVARTQANVHLSVKSSTSSSEIQSQTCSRCADVVWPLTCHLKFEPWGFEADQMSTTRCNAVGSAVPLRQSHG